MISYIILIPTYVFIFISVSCGEKSSMNVCVCDKAALRKHLSRQFQDKRYCLGGCVNISAKILRHKYSVSSPIIILTKTLSVGTKKHKPDLSTFKMSVSALVCYTGL